MGKFMKTLLILLAITVNMSFCKSQVENTEEGITKNISDTTEDVKNLIADINDNSYDKFEIIKRAKLGFNQYIKKRIKEIDPDGYAYEYEEARQYYVGDINLDKIPDAIVLYTIEGVGGGNNWYRHLVMFINDGNKFTALNHVVVFGTFEGQAELVGIKNGYVIFDKMEFNSNDFFEKLDEKQPTKYRRIGYGIRGNEIVIDELK